jgi:hypothetical protein
MPTANVPRQVRLDPAPEEGRRPADAVLRRVQEDEGAAVAAFEHPDARGERHPLVSALLGAIERGRVRLVLRPRRVQQAEHAFGDRRSVALAEAREARLGGIAGEGGSGDGQEEREEQHPGHVHLEGRRGTATDQHTG